MTDEHGWVTDLGRIKRPRRVGNEVNAANVLVRIVELDRLTGVHCHFASALCA
jgi:hypothetical protein